MERAAEPRAEQGPAHRPSFARGTAGALAGGAAGYLICGWLATQGFYAIALPGVLLGIAAGWLIGGRSLPFSIVCGVFGLILGTLAEWANFPFTQDKSLGFFLAHLSDLRPFTLLMIALSGVGAFWFTWRNRWHRPGLS